MSLLSLGEAGLGEAAANRRLDREMRVLKTT